MRFLAWITDRGMTLATTTQADVDAWLDAGTASQSALLADFFRWSNQRGLTKALEAPTAKRSEPDLSMTSEERGAQLRRALTDEAVPLDVRAAAALLYLYGLPVSRIARIQLDDLVVHRDTAHLLVGGHRTILPPVVDRVLRAAADAARPRSTIGQVVSGPRWLYPGQRAGLPLAGNSLAGRLRRHGFPILTRRNAARLELAGEMPAAALSVILGISLSGAVHCAKRATRDWNAFVEARNSQHERPSGGRG